MDPSHKVEQALQIVESVLALRGDARRQYIENRCAGDAELRQEVESLLRHQRCLDAPTEPDTSETD